MKTIIPSIVLAFDLSGCGAVTNETLEKSSKSVAESTSGTETLKQASNSKVSETVFETLAWEDLLPEGEEQVLDKLYSCFLYTSPRPRDRKKSRMPSSA